ncbi:MAG: BatD family protein [candidate division Zixibacteria bacterium]|nr:BatD family protein [candidate division Zixibacteria bacterium]
MNRVLSLLIAVSLASLFFVGMAWGAGGIDITAAVDKQTAYIGDLINYSVTITYDSTLRLTPPAVGANLGGFDVKDYHVSDEQKVDQGRRREVLSFNIRTFTTGDYVIPPLPVEYRLPDSTVKTIAADPIKITIKSVLAEGASADTLTLRPLKKQASLAKSHTAMIVTIIVLVVLAAAYYYFIYRRRGRAEEAFIDPRPAWEIAFAELAMLREKDYLAKGELKAYYTELTEIFRKYTGKKFDFAAIDMTTEEIDIILAGMPVDQALEKDMIGFLEHADLVKFAKYVPSAERPTQDWESAYSLVDKTKDIIVMPPTEAMPVLEPVMGGAAEAGSIPDSDGLKYAPPELREYFASKNREDER